MKVKNAVAGVVIVIFVLLFIYFFPKGGNEPIAEAQPLSKPLSKGERDLEEKRTKSKQNIEDVQKKLDGAYRRLDEVVSKLREKKDLEQQKELEEAKKLQQLQKKMEKKNERLMKEEEKLLNWKDKQEEKHEQERNEIIKVKENDLEQINAEKRDLEKKLQEEQANQQVLQVELKQEKQELSNIPQSSPEQQKKIEEKIEELKEKMNENQILKLDLKKKLVDDKSKESQDEIALKHLRDEKVNEISQEADQAEKELSEEVEQEIKRKKKIDEIEKDIRTLKNSVYTDKTAHNDEQAKIKEEKIKADNAKVDKLYSQLDRDREKQDENLVELHRKQIEKEEAEIEKKEFELKQFNEGQKNADHNIFQTRAKEMQIEKEIKDKIKDSPLDLNDTAKIDAKKEQLKELKDAENFQKEFSDFFMRNKPKIVKDIYDDKLKVIKDEISDKQEGLRLKEQHESELRKEADQVRNDIQEITELEKEGDSDKIELKKKVIRQKELEVNLKNEKDDEQELKAEIDTRHQIYNQIKEAEENEIILNNMEKDVMDKESKLSDSFASSSPEQIDNVKQEIKDVENTENKIRNHIAELDRDILQKEIDESNRIKDIASDREHYFEQNVQAEKQNIKNLEDTIENIKNSPALNLNLELNKQQLEIEKDAKNYNERKAMIEEREAQRAEHHAQDIERELKQKTVDNAHKLEWENEIKHFDDDEILSNLDSEDRDIEHKIVDAIQNNKHVIDRSHAQLYPEEHSGNNDDSNSHNEIDHFIDKHADPDSQAHNNDPNNSDSEKEEEHNLAAEKLNTFDDKPKTNDDPRGHLDDVSDAVNSIISNEIEKHANEIPKYEHDDDHESNHHGSDDAAHAPQAESGAFSISESELKQDADDIISQLKNEESQNPPSEQIEHIVEPGFPDSPNEDQNNNPGKSLGRNKYNHDAQPPAKVSN